MMTGRVSRLCLALLAMLLVSAGAGAQYQPGDYVVGPGVLGQYWQLFGCTPAGKVFTLNSPAVHGIQGLILSPDNRGLWVSAWGPQLPHGIYEVAPNGVFTTIALAKTSLYPPFLIQASGTGAAVAIDGAANAIIHVDKRTGITTLRRYGCTFPPCSGTVCGVDEETGDVYLKSMNALECLRTVPPYSQTTIAVGMKENLGCFGGFDAHRDEMICSYSGLFSGVNHSGFLGFRVRPGLGLSTLQQYKWSRHVTTQALDVHVDSAERTAATLHYEDTGHYSTYINLVDLDTRSRIRRIMTISPSLLYANAVVRAHSRHLSGISPALRGGVFSVLVSSPTEPGARYVAAFSFGMRPGIAVPGGRRIHLVPDALFHLSLTNAGIFSNCQGTLDSRGEAVAAVAIPRIPTLAGRRFFAAAVTIAGGGIRTISGPVGVTIR